MAASNVGQSRVDTRKNRTRNANRFENLVETDTEVHEISGHAQVEKAVSDALKNVKTSDATKGTKSKSNGDNLPLDIGRIIAQVISAIEPLLVKAVVNATETAVAQICESNAKQSEVNNLRNEVQLLKFELDRLNQYSRRDSVRISGIPESEDENTNDIVKQLAADIGVTLTPNDISVSHRLPGRQGTAKPIIVKFVRRNMKTAFMKNKRRLRDLNRKGVFLNDDLTPFRAKLTRVLRNDPTIGNVWTIDGRIFCITTENGKEMKRIVETPDDLFNLGWSEEKIKGLNLYV